MNIQELIALLQGNPDANINMSINVTCNNPAPIDDAPDMPDTDFEEDDRVLVCHIRNNGERVHTIGTVIEVCGKDDKGWYTRVLGDNGKHYRAGLKYNEERLGTVIYQLEA